MENSVHMAHATKFSKSTCNLHFHKRERVKGGGEILSPLSKKKQLKGFQNEKMGGVVHGG